MFTKIYQQLIEKLFQFCQKILGLGQMRISVKLLEYSRNHHDIFFCSSRHKILKQLLYLLQPMSEYEFGNMPYFENYSGSDNLLGLFEDKNFDNFEFKPDILPTINQTIHPTQISVIPEKIHVDKAISFEKRRSKTKIECSLEKKKQLQRNYRGSPDETIQLNTNFKTIVCNFLKQLICLREVTEKDMENIQKFKNSVPSFEAFNQLLKSDNSNSQLRMKCVQYVSSTKIIKQIMTSRAKHHRKLRMLKYIQVLRHNIVNDKQDFIRWKTLNKHKVESI